jgi:cardiolipin synthase
VAGWAFAIWGSALYWCAGLLYIVQARALLAAGPPGGAPGGAGEASGGGPGEGSAGQR